jgi:hypothetical protein
VPELEVALDERFNETPAHIDETLAEAETAVGVGLTTKVFELEAVPHDPPVEVKVKVAVPV